jgi:hypothetical protein
VSIGATEKRLSSDFAIPQEPSDGLEPSTPSLPSSDGAGTAGKGESRWREDPASRMNRPKTTNRAWTLVPAVVFPQCSLGRWPNISGESTLGKPGPNGLAEIGRQLLIRKDELFPARPDIAGLPAGEVRGEVFGVDLPPGAVEGDLVHGHALDLDDQDGLIAAADVKFHDVV